MKRTTHPFLSTLATGILGIGLMIGGGTAYAADRNPCSGDIAKFCKDIDRRDAGEIMRCLEAHEKELSDACRKYEEKMGGRGVERGEVIRKKVMFRQACKNDIVKFCGDVEPGPGVIEKCLNQHESELSVPCRERIKEK